MRPSWVPIFVILIGVGCAAFALMPPRWSPALSQGILTGMVMYLVAFTPPITAARARIGIIPPLFGPQGILPAVLYRVAAFLAILLVIAYLYFDRRAFFDVTWPILILAAWNLADSMLNRRGRLRT
ncbi:MAG TPA: hypothetical protein VEU09_01495 [Candidatus Binatia bacterium]|nr:hypothetical protein [Candidatus Binatia bacterium]